jgi:hypothetical protein
MRIALTDLQFESPNRFVTDISHLNNKDDQDVLKVLNNYPDNQDIIVEVGFPVAEAIFFLDEITAAPDRKVIYWTLLPTIETTQKFLRLGGSSIIIYNDL